MQGMDVLSLTGLHAGYIGTPKWSLSLLHKGSNRLLVLLLSPCLLILQIHFLSFFSPVPDRTILLSKGNAKLR